MDQFLAMAFAQLTGKESSGGGGSGNYFTYYSFDALGKLAQVQMPRGGTTQTRTWSYSNSTQRLSSMTQPETGTTTFTYNQERLASKCEASNKEHRYNYDSYGRLSSIYKGVCGGGTDLDRTITFQYDSGEAWQTNLKGRLAKISYKIGQGGTSGGQEPTEEFFAYTTPGQITRKDWRMQRSGVWMGLMSLYGYDAEGRRNMMRYPKRCGIRNRGACRSSSWSTVMTRCRGCSGLRRRAAGRCGPTTRSTGWAGN